MIKAGKLTAVLLFLLSLGLFAGAVDAVAFRAPLKQPANGSEEWLETGKAPIEGACGVAFDSANSAIVVSDYYHQAVRSFSASGTLAGVFGFSPLEISESNAICGLALAPDGTLYGNEFHQQALRLSDDEPIDPGPATGVAVDADGNVYVDDRTYVAVYDAPVIPGEAPALKIGADSLVDAYGVAVNSGTGRVYVADAASGTVKVFNPAGNPAVPIDTIEGPSGDFSSLVNASLAVDESPTEGEGHLLVVDDLKPGGEFPQAAVYEFSSSGSFLDRLQTRLVGSQGFEQEGPIFGEPSGIAVDSKSGDLYVTTGNSEGANVVKYGPFKETAPLSPLGSAEQTVAEQANARLLARPKASTAGGASASVVEQRRGVRVSFDGKLSPHALPRHGTAPVGIVVDARISATGDQDPPQLRRITIAINRNGHFSSKGLSSCRIEQIQPSTTSNALAACRSALVGEGHFSANVKLPQQSPFPSSGKVLAFNGVINGRPAILAHIYGTDPAPTSTVLPFFLRDGRGTYGTTLEASLPQATGSWGYVTGLKMNLHRRFSYRGHSRSFLSAGCPAPAGFPSASFPLAKTSFAFAGNLKLEAVLNRTCKAQG